MTSTVASGERQACTFVVGDLLLGVPLAEVSEVVPGEDVTPVPLAPRAVLGMFSLRGRIVTVVDGRLRLELPARGPGEGAGCHVIVRSNGDLVSLVVDRTSDVVTLGDAAAESVPETVRPGIRRLVTASYQQPQGLLLLLDPARVLSVN